MQQDRSHPHSLIYSIQAQIPRLPHTLPPLNIISVTTLIEVASEATYNKIKCQQIDISNRFPDLNNMQY